MVEIYIVAIVVIICSIWLYLSLRKRIDEIGGGQPKELPPVNIYCTPQCMTQGSQIPQVSVSPAPSSNEEMAAVVMAAIAAYESEAGEMTGISPPAALDIARVAPAHAHAVEKYKHSRRDQRWTATARYENHKRL
ncbi:MAG: hypothetical protein FWE24_07980 [Defluviitaleaceae bacterium]|nr:hypothetical protein [Defluviitaleaceae bacterium]